MHRQLRERAGGEARELRGTHHVKCVGQGEEFTFYSKCNVKMLKAEQRADVISFLFE